MIAHHDSRIASAVFTIHTNMNGLYGPSQLTSEKLKIRISTPTISSERKLRPTAALIRRRIVTLNLLSPTTRQARGAEHRWRRTRRHATCLAGQRHRFGGEPCPSPAFWPFPPRLARLGGPCSTRAKRCSCP